MARAALVIALVAALALSTSASALTQPSSANQCVFEGVWTPSGQWYNGPELYCYCQNGKWIDCQQINKVVATFDTPLLKGFIYATQGYDLTRNTWVADFSYFDQLNLCPSGEMNWHVHTYWSPEISGTSSLDQCGLDLTGNHYDPTFGCGPNSQFAGAGGLCETVRPYTNGVQTCDLPNDVSTCEIGDLSAKVGRLYLVKKPQFWDDRFSTNIELFRKQSVVLHCCSPKGCAPRVACAQFL
mmetsp:Transcript_3240/g.9216  ORF Transcript_3240/g.9216 Transcript_3240/m.9216 type:complete len:241 (+) Transcript_3240:251-973(+)|eukprot:CAMPEP_0117655426 /NCGR_PEP_ID=MMETSP0804-20121206/4273_1 /TAXON_ID=1074897 /ORGANISM="Tetraselmis astigmatica, Strain CCMP880" /LENGTH=240 /DNA_ID=CAMNT_0005461777 /DNA_START=247 /DNA_END=969 /DNA_ORIENTATION=+